MKNLSISAVAILLVLKPALSQALPQNVFVDDARKPVTAFGPPASMIGKLSIPGGSWCTAGLVSKDVVVTAAHCVVDAQKKAVITNGAFVFLQGVVGGQAQDRALATPIRVGTLDPQGDRKLDWAFLRLDQPLGTKYGWMELRSLDLKTLYDRGGISMTAFSRDFQGGNTAGAEEDCSFTGAREGYYLHNCDMSRGASGAPMYRAETDSSGATAYYILAINVADLRGESSDSLLGVPFSQERANVAVGASRFVAALQEILSGQWGL